MGPVDVLILLAVAVGLVLAVRSLLRRGSGACSGCGSRGTCAAHATGAPCPAAESMLRNAEKNLGK